MNKAEQKQREQHPEDSDKRYTSENLYCGIQMIGVSSMMQEYMAKKKGSHKW